MSIHIIKSYRFREEREADWHRLDEMIRRAERKGAQSLSEEDMAALPSLYRQAISSLSVARSISLDQNVTAYLESLTARAYFFVYGSRTRMSEKIAQFLRRDWPAAISQTLGPTLLAALCLFGPALLAFILTLNDSEWYWTFHNGLDDRNPNASYAELRASLYNTQDNILDILSAFAAELFSNNAMVAIFAFALGFALGIPTAILLAYNGVMIGSFFAVFVEKDLGMELTGWLLIHGVTELYAIILAGAAGFIIGGAVAFPGTQTRLNALKSAGERAGPVIAGAVLMLFIAALIESFGRELITNDIVRYSFALVSLAFWLCYFYLPRQSSSGTSR